MATEFNFAVPHKVFVSHAKSDDHELLSRLKAEIRALFTMSKVTLGYDDYGNFGIGSSWEGWQRSVACGLEYGTTNPRYDTFVTVNPVLGKSSYGILALALENGKDCFYYDSKNKSIHRVYNIDLIRNGESWVSYGVVDTNDPAYLGQH